LQALLEGGEALDTWREYHLIGDALRDANVLSKGFSMRFAARLAEEPEGTENVGKT
jgi:negative regulator of sigma E activity